ncbi:M20 family metallopeptidase [Thalassorhabdus alkalitolerans]|uniref:M20 family metallopeptidase n=1 Tax=Thalassorhabdus alkalitolerans TaxID=2282697 RepID=A0ABW0YRX2_9BACI|nr:M20 family metallopeptidase [Thalassobacillus sp. C254]
MSLEIKGLGKEIEETLIEYRRYFHENPELSQEEEHTSKTIQKFLDEHDIPYETGFATHGILAIIEGEKEGKTIALRGDMDALPIDEKTGLPYASKKEGVMHACGHDAHTAMLMGVALILKKKQDKLPGKVLLVFQPAEELSPIGGAEDMMKDGVFSKHKPDAIFAQHAQPELEVGEVGVLSGPVQANSDRFKITIKGEGGHASKPHQGKDAIVVAGQVISDLQTIISRSVDPLESAVLTLGEIHGGKRYNVLPGEVTIEGTLRTYKDDVKETARSRMEDILSGLEEAMGVTIQLEYLDGYPAVVNSKEWEETLRSSVEKIVGQKSMPEVQPSLGGEDFGRFLEEYPGFFYWIGTAIPGRERQKPLHDEEFEFNEDTLVPGTEIMAQLAVDALENLAQK